MSSQPAPPFTGQHLFSNVDQQAIPTAFVTHLDKIIAMDQALAYKGHTYDLLHIQPGQHLLDVGCGAGDDVRAMAERVGAAGSVIGLDNSATMIHTAQERTSGVPLSVEFRLGNVMQLDFPTATFDGVRADRVLHHITGYEQAFAEMVRITRRHGRVVIFEPDFDGMIINAPDKAMTRQVIHTYTDRFAQGQCGRQLYQLYKAADLQEIALYPIPFLFTEVALAEQLIGLSTLISDMATSQPAKAEQLARWLDGVKQAGEEGAFFFMLLGITVVGTKT